MDTGDILDLKKVYELIDLKTPEIIRNTELRKYYETENPEIMAREKDEYKANNKLKYANAKYIVDVASGYFLGIPVNYTSNNDVMMEDIRVIFDDNDEQDHSFELGKECSIVGKAYEILYTVDNDTKFIKFKMLDTDEVIIVRNDDIEKNIKYALRFWLDDDKNLNIEKYDSEYVRIYLQDGEKLVMIDKVQHYFKDVPIIEYVNNKECQSDITPVLDQIKQYDKINSDTANDFEEFTNCYMVWKGYSGIIEGDDSEEQVNNMKQNRLIFTDENGGVDFLTKNINDVALENFKNRLTNDIHKLSLTPNVTDENFASNASGIAMKYKLYGLEQKTSVKERKFKKSINQRLKLIINLLSFSKTGYFVDEIKIIFKRNHIANLVEIVDTANKSLNLVSKKTVLEMLPFVDNVDDEIIKLEEERQDMEQYLSQQTEVI